MYDELSSHYDRFVNWNARLQVELPFLLEQVRRAGEGQAGPARVLDAACGTGRHAIAIAQASGAQVWGADLSSPMVAAARANAVAEGVQVRFETAGFGELAEVFGAGGFDALLCLGNSLPHAVEPEGLEAALADFSECLRPGGRLVVQNRNFDRVQAQRERWMEPQAHREGQAEWIFVRFYDFDPDGLITFNMITLSRESAGPWSQQVTATRLRPLTQDVLLPALEKAGFGEVEQYGDMSGAAFQPEASGNLVLIAHKR